jgi:hypothetical protein
MYNNQLLNYCELGHTIYVICVVFHVESESEIRLAVSLSVTEIQHIKCVVTPTHIH